jgi:tryptophanyl-tRNA synthetase
MSTTGGTPQGTVLVLDEPETIRRKFKSAVTDTGREIVRAVDKPGISNLIELLAAAHDLDPVAVEAEYANASGYADFKRDVGEAIVELLAPVRERYGPIRQDEAALEKTLREGADKAREIAADTLRLARSHMGLGPPA